MVANAIAEVAISEAMADTAEPELCEASAAPVWTAQDDTDWASSAHSPHAPALVSACEAGSVSNMGEFKSPNAAFSSGFDITHTTPSAVSGTVSGTPAVESEEFKYCLLNRPADFGAVPKGFIRIEDRPAIGQPHHEYARHGIVVYDRKLSDREVLDYELSPVADTDTIAAICAMVANDMADYAGKYLDMARDRWADFENITAKISRRIPKISYSLGLSNCDFADMVIKSLAKMWKAQNDTKNAPIAAPAPTQAIFTGGTVSPSGGNAAHTPTPMEFLPETPSPLMAQHMAFKANHKNAMLFYRMGDFYELFNADAENGARLLNITITQRSNGNAQPIKMAGVPFHAIDSSIATLVAMGESVAVCELVGTSSGKFERKITRTESPAPTPAPVESTDTPTPTVAEFLPGEAITANSTWDKNQRVYGVYFGVPYAGFIADSRATPDWKNVIFSIELDSEITVYGRNRIGVEILTSEPRNSIFYAPTTPAVEIQAATPAVETETAPTYGDGLETWEMETHIFAKQSRDNPHWTQSYTGLDDGDYLRDCFATHARIVAEHEAKQAQEVPAVTTPEAPAFKLRPTVVSKSGNWCAWFILTQFGQFGLTFDNIKANTSNASTYATASERMKALQAMAKAADAPDDTPPGSAETPENADLGTAASTTPAVSSESPTTPVAVSSEAPADFVRMKPVRVDLADIVARGAKSESLIGLGVYYSGDRANPSGSGAVTAVGISEWYGLTVDVTLESGYIWKAIRTREFLNGSFALDGKMHGAPYLAELAAKVAMEKASESAAEDQKEKAHTQALIDFAAQYPQLKKSESRYAGGKLAASNARILLKQAFKGVKFSVTSDHNKLRIEWQDGPTDGQVNDVVGMFDIGASDTQSDYFYTVSTAFSELFGGVQYMTTKRNVSDALVQEAIDKVYENRHEDKPMAQDYQKNTGVFNWDYINDNNRRMVRAALETISKM